MKAVSKLDEKNNEQLNTKSNTGGRGRAWATDCRNGRGWEHRSSGGFRRNKSGNGPSIKFGYIDFVHTGKEEINVRF